MQTAKVYIWKETDKTLEDPFPWKVGTPDVDGWVMIRKELETYDEAWEWLYTNYKRDTV